jgi:hypothetical protein
MPIFDNELLGNQSNRNYNTPDIDISSSGEAFKEIDSEIGINVPGQFSEPFQGITADQARNFKGGFMPMNVNSPFSVVSKSELLANQRYPLYERGVNLENIYGLQQSWYEQLGNGLVKMGANALGSFAQSFATIPNTATALKNGSVSDLSNPDGYESSIDTWLRNVENYFPNYVTEYEKSRGLTTAIPFTYGSANFWGDKILKNSGFMVGAIGGAIAQDAIIGVATEGIGAIPLVASQLGRASLYLNKLFAGANKVDRVLDMARAAGKSEQTLLNIERLGQLAAAQKLTNGFRYGMSVYGSARTEAAIESRESYRTIKEELTEQYKLDNFGEEPTPEAIQQIEDYATDAMNARFGINMALLTVSNAVQFDNIFKSFTGAQKGITSSALKDFGSAGKVGLKEGTLDTFEKKLPQTFSGKAWEFAKPKAINVFTEGVYEEGGQFATQVGVEDYYTRKYKAQGKESWDFVKEAMSSTAKGMAEQFGSSEGIESMVIGAITAAITGPVVDRVTGKSKQDNQRLNSTLNILNQYGMTGVLSNKYEDTSRSVEISRQMNDAVKSGNIFKFKNLKSDMFFGFVNSRIPLGMHDVTIEQLQMLKDLPKEEFEKTFGMDFNSSNQSTVSGYVDALIQKANNINDITTSINSTFNNPYSRIIDPKTDDERAEALKYGMFENWKTDLASFSYMQQDSNQRIADIQTSISQVNPLLTNDLLTLATSEKGLKELSDVYEQKANLLSESLANLSPAERTAKREEIKKLRTLSEKISIALNSKNIDPKLFNDLLNFELSGQDFSQPNVLRIDETTGLTTYAEDLNKLIGRREKAATQFEDLSTEKGFDKYFAQEEEKQKQKEEEGQQSLFPQDEKFGFLNKTGKKETAEVGREYQIPGFSPAKVRKVGEQFKVTSPTGEVKYYDTREEAKQAADDLNVDFSELTTVKILALNDDGTIKIEDLAGNIQNINPSVLKGYEKLQTEEEKLAKDKETLDKQQEKLEQGSATVVTINPKEGDIVGSEEQRKDASILYLSTSTPSEDTAGEVKNKLPHIVRARKFLNNLKFFNNRDKYKVIIVTPNNAKDLGLEGIVQLSYEKNITEPLTADQTNVELGFMAQVFILQTPEGDFFVNEKGEKLSKVGDENPTILDEVIFETMTSAKPITEGGYVKVRAGQEEEAERALEAYKIFRADVFKQKGYTPYSFDISRGIPRQNKINGVRENNNVGVILGDNAEDIIANTEGLIQIVTTGKIQHKGELLSFPAGTTLIQYGDLLDFVNNKNLTNYQASTVFSLIEIISKEMITQSNTGKPVKINYAYSNFLQNILYWKSKADTKTPSQIGIDTTNMTFNIGGRSFPLSKISENKQDIMDVLQNAFITVNNNTLKLGPSKKFTEYKADKDGNITKVEWPNYQSYLLSGKNPDDSKRSIEETPLITHTAAPTDTQASYKQKYSYITDGNVLPYDKIPAKPKPAPTQPSAPGGTIIGEYELNTGKVNTFGEFNTGPILFTGTVTPEGYVSVDINTNETITKLSTEPQLIAAVDGNLRALPENIVTIDLDKSTNEDKAKLFVKLRIEGELGQTLEAQGTTPAEAAPTAPTVVEETEEIDSQETVQQTLNDDLGVTSKITKSIYLNGLHYLGTEDGKFYVVPDSNGEYTRETSKEVTKEEINKPFRTQVEWDEVRGVSTPKIEGEKPYDPSKRKRGKNGPSEFRMVGADVSDRMTNAELEEFKAWHAKNVPGVPFEVLERMIQVNDNEEAWGVFENGIAKFVRGGLKGTEYHEVFEGIWASFLSESEREAILNEFRNQQGQFTDRESGKVYDYSDPAVTDRMIKERIADDFADFRLGKIKARSLSEKIRALFNRIMNFFKKFGTNKSLKESLFKAIDSGKYKEAKISERVKSYAPEYRAVEGLTEQQTNDYIQDMVAQMKMIIFQEGRKDLLFNPEKMSGADVLNILRDEYEELGEIDALGENRYNQLVKRATEYLKTIGVTINADEVVSINDEERTGKEYAQDPFSTDWKKYSTGALKFLLSTLTERNALNQTNIEVGKKLQPAEEKLSDVGFKLLNFNRVFVTLMDRLHNTNDVDVFIEKLVQLAKEDSNYLPLFRALGGNLETHTIDFSNQEFKESDWRLFIQFFNTFSRQKPEAVIQYTSDDLKVYSAPANIFTIINQTVDSWVDNMKVIGKGRGGIISYARQSKVYRINTVELAKLPIKKSIDQVNFLAKIGVEFPIGTYEALSNKQQIIKGKKSSELEQFTDAVQKIYTQLGKNNDLMTFDAKRLDISGPLRTLAELYARVNNPNQDSTYFGVEGQRISSFAENDAPSYFENDFNESGTLNELLEKRPELKDVFSKGSQILKKGGLFFDKDGNRIAEIKVEYIQGSKNLFTGKNKTTAKLELGDRFIQEMNQNINGKYYVLIPGDSSTEWMVNLGNVISMDDILDGSYWNKVNTIYNGYLEDEINLALENRQQNKYVKSKAQELRFMKDLLPSKIVEKIEKMIEDDSTFADIQKYVSDNRDEINTSIKSTFESISEDTFNILLNNKKIIQVGENEYMFMGLDSEFMSKYRLTGDLSKDQVMNIINFLNLNYEINNIEYHKFIFGDPYQFKTEKGKLDETKRIKSFLSPRRRTFNHPEFNNFLKRTYNSVDGIVLEKGTPGHHEYKAYVNTATFNNVDIVGSLANINPAYAKVDETDAMSWLMDNTHKEIALKEGQWSAEAEVFHQWHMAYTRQAFLKKNLFKTKELKDAYENSPLSKKDAALILTTIPKHKLAVRKPIVSGNKANKTEIDLVLDKTSQMPLYYHMVEGTALESMYLKMFNQELGYGIVVSGRKVGVENPHSIYNSNGKFNESPIENIIEVPWSIYGTQVETMSEGEKTQTRGSQLTKMASMDLYNNGEPTSLEAKEAYEENMKFLNLLNENAYNTLLERLGVEDIDGEFVMVDGTAVSATLMGEMLRRELSENAKDTIELDSETKQFLIPFEASPSYLQIKSILYSLVNNALVSPKMSGAPHVQAPVTMFEKATEGRSVVRKIDGQWTKINKKQYEALTEEEKKGVMLTDDTLKFYAPGSPYCEIMLPNWFSKELKKGNLKNYTDDQLIDYLNKTPDGKKILSGIAFRIPTQALSSVEVFRVKKFLPEYMGYTVIVPSEITTKAGSDFDIDKLNMYLKSIYIDENGNVKLVSYKGSEQATKDFYSDVWTKTREKEIANIKDKDVFRENLYKLFNTLEGLTVPLTKDQQNFYDMHFNIINDIIEQADEKDMIPSQYILNQISKLANKEFELTSSLISGLGKEEYTKKMYKKSLENEYYASLEKLLTLPENFDRLISPVDDAGLEKMSEVLDEARGYNETGIKARLINRNYMTNMRHAFITGKRWVGIAAVNITNLSLRQKSKVYLDPTKVTLLPKKERSFVKDLSIILPHNTVDVNGQKYVSLSGTMTKDGKQLISQRLSGYATAFVDIANKPFITKIIKSDVVVSTFMFLESIGAGNTGVYFLNQPIIDKYLEYLDSKGSKNVMSNDDLDYIKSLFPTTEQQLKNTEISVDGLLKNIEEYGEKKKFDAKKNAEQQLILNEFVKYKILADQLFAYTQATNYDTTRFSSSDTYLKKEWGTMNAANYNLISNVNDVLAKTFIGKLSELLSNSYQALGAVMVTENPKIKAYTLSTLKRYATKKYMSLNDYEKISNLIKNSFIDFVIQNNTTVREMIEPFLINSATSIVNKLEQAKQKYPSNQLIQDLAPVLGNREGSAKSITIKANIKDAYSENLYTGMMRELRDSENSDLKELYDDIINVSILQGTGQSAISIRNIIPIEDYSKKIAPIFQQLQASNSLKAFENAMFERNNFTNSELFEDFKPVIWKPFPNRNTGEYDKEQYMFDPITGEDKLIHTFPNFSIAGFGANRTLIKLSEQYNSFQLASDFIKVPKVISDKEGKKFNVATGTEISKADYAYMMKKGDFNLFDAYYYKKVYTKSLDEFGNLIPLSTYDEKVGRQYYYKLINVYGDGNRAVEMNTNFTPSVIDNGSMRVSNEMSDDQIVSMINPGSEKQVVPLPTQTTGMATLQSGKEEFDKLPSKSSTPTMTYAGIGSRETPKEVMDQMTELAKELESRGYTLRSGGAQGADTAFEKGVTSKKEIFPGAQKSGEREMKIAREIHPNPNALDNSKNPAFVWNLMARNTNQVFGKNLDTPVDFVIAYTQDGLTDYTKRTIKSGGTGQAIDMASRKGIPVINLANSNWRQELDKVLSTPTQVAEQPTEAAPERVTINLQPDNREMIANGQKTTTIRTQKEFEYIGLPVGATAKTTINGVEFNVTNRGLLSIDEVGRENILASEGLTSAEDFKFPTSKKWFDGQGKLYVYDFTKAKVTIDEQLTGGISYETVDRYTDADVKANPDKIYIFGDNTKRVGTGGQAVIRNNPNAMGIATKLEPSNKPNAFMSDDQFEENKQIIDSDITKIISKAESTGKSLVFPADGFGTGLAQLPTKAPKTYDYLRRALYNNFGFWNGEEQPPSLSIPVEKGPSVSIFESRNVQIDYTQGQRTALTDIANLIDKGGDGYYLLAGYAGTGKTTIAENIAKYGTQSGKAISVLAPTNKAAKVLNDKLKSTGVASQPTTIHKAIYGEPDPDTGEWVAKSDIKNSVIIVDESSMIAKEVMEDLLRLTKGKNNTIIFMGDSFQLEPVGEDSGLFKGKVREVNDSKSELTEVKRQSLDSDILKVATVIRNDKVAYVPETSTKDFKITNSKNEFIQNFKQSVKNNEDVAMIVATNAERILMNKLAREAKFGKDVDNVINPNETIISIANSSEYSNSELFNIKDLRGEPTKYSITFTDNYGKESRYDIYLAYVVNDGNKEIPILLLPAIDKPSVYHAQILKAARESSNRELYNALSGWIFSTNRGAEKLSPALTIGTYGYAITAHKSQGSQWEKVFVNQNYSAPGSDAARWFYTAITRAAKEVEVFPTRVNTTIKNSDVDAKLSNIVAENLISLKDGKQYSPEQINSTMLEQMGYSPEEIGKILKSIC